MGETTSFYDILGIAPTASESEIRTAYYGLAKTAHPDRNRDDPHAAERFKIISAAYDTLRDPQSRSRYDMFGKDAPHHSLADPAIRFKVWCLAALAYLVLIVFNWITGYSLEGLLSLGILGAVIYAAGRKPGRLETVMIVAFLAVWLLSPNFIIQLSRFLSRLSAAIAIIACANAFVVDIDVSVIFGFLVVVIEMFWRGSSTAWPSLSILSTLVYMLVVLIAIGYLLEHPAMLAESYFMLNGNMLSVVPIIVAVGLILLDLLGQYLVPAFLQGYTMPLTWVLLMMLVGAFAVLAIFAKQLRLVGILAVSTLLSYFFMAYLPSKLTAFLVSFAYWALFSAAVYCLEVIATSNNPQAAWPYEVAALGALVIDLSSGHYSSLGSAEWVRLSGMLAVNGLISVFFVIGLVPAIKAHIAQKAAEDAGKEGATQN